MPLQKGKKSTHTYTYINKYMHKIHTRIYMYAYEYINKLFIYGGIIMV